MRQPLPVRLCAFLLFFVGAGCAYAQDTTPADSAATAMPEKVQALADTEDAQVRGATIAWVEWIHEFYANRSFRPAWTDAHSSWELLRAIEDSRLDGLDPDDYHLPLLQQLAREANAPAATDVVRAQFDVLQTDALLRLGYHLYFGKVAPESFDAQWNYGRTPTHPFFIRLKDELRRYRAASATGNPPQLADGPTLKAGMSDPRVSVLRGRLVASGDLASPAAATPELFDDAVEAAVRRFHSEAGYVSGRIIKTHTRDTEYKGHSRHASRNEPQYEIKSDKTDHIAMHKGPALHKIA